MYTGRVYILSILSALSVAACVNSMSGAAGLRPADATATYAGNPAMLGDCLRQYILDDDECDAHYQTLTVAKDEGGTTTVACANHPQGAWGGVPLGLAGGVVGILVAGGLAEAGKAASGGKETPVYSACLTMVADGHSRAEF